MARVAARCNQSCANYLGILDPWIAAIVDLEADEALTEYEDRKQVELLGAMGLGAAMNQLPIELQSRLNSAGPRHLRQ